ncbi:hypothetical protein D3OALGA1CA_1671 [Olavius algarvensis associated proteobacterium Delta 3]|nr:hypothetical protein D3OALGA1CA_1671 [Olavius algarvensis associated proteobacterium Delta 3]
MVRARFGAVRLVALCLTLAFVTTACKAQKFVENIGLREPEELKVTKTEDTNDGKCSSLDCSLREAVIASNERPGQDIIIVPKGVYRLTIHGNEDQSSDIDTFDKTGDLDIFDDLIIRGDGPGQVIVDANEIDRAFEVWFSSDVDMSGLTIRNGASRLAGGGIANGNTNHTSIGFLMLSDVEIRDSQSKFGGGGVYNKGGRLLFTKVTISKNRSDEGGGGLHNDRGPMMLVNSLIVRNRAKVGGGIFNQTYAAQSAKLIGVTVRDNEAVSGGGIYNNLGTLKVEGDSVIRENRAEKFGGGIFNAMQEFDIAGGRDLDGTTTLTVEDSRIEHNKSIFGGGGLLVGVDTKASVTRTLIAMNLTGNQGGGLHNRGTMTVEDSCFFKNNAAKGGGVVNGVGADLSLVNVTVSGNQADIIAGGLGNASAGSTMRIVNGTIFNNSPHGIVELGGKTNLFNTIVAGNSPANCKGGVQSQANNLDSGSSCAFTGPNDLSNTDPMLDAITPFGAGNLLHPLKADSPAIDMGDDATCPDHDQRGAPRPQLTACDIGAFEFGPPL